MEQEYPVDLDELRRTIDRADVIALFFPYFHKTLLLDTRATRVDPPMARVVPMVRTAQERMEELRRLRPRFDRPRALALIGWPRSVASVKALGVWAALVERFAAAGSDGCEATLERCYRALVREERAELRRAVRGEGYRTVWHRPTDA
jgi:hypothetical protein